MYRLLFPVAMMMMIWKRKNNIKGLMVKEKSRIYLIIIVEPFTSEVTWQLFTFAAN